MKKYIKIQRILMCFLIFFLTISLASAYQNKKIIFISSYKPNFPTPSHQIRGIKSILDKDNYSLNLNVIASKSSKAAKKPSFYEAYKLIVLIRAGVFIVMISLIIWLIINIAKRKKAEKNLINRNNELTALYEKLYISKEEIKTQYFRLNENRKEIMKREERFKLIFEASNEGLWDFDFDKGNFYYSQSLLEILGANFHASMPSIDSWSKYIHPDDRHKIKAALDNILSAKIDKFNFEYTFLQDTGEYKWIYTKGKCLRDPEEKLKLIAGSCTDIHKKKIQDEKIRKLAYFDSLTNLPNRILLDTILSNEIKKAETSKRGGTIFLIDIDNFKVINDTFGHSLGDKILIKVSDRFRSLINGDNLVARSGGDEFVLILKHIATRKEIHTLCNSIVKVFEKPFGVEGKEFYLTLSIGIALYPKDGDNVTELLKNADTAMYKAKALGKNQCVYFKKEMNEKLFRKIQLQNELRNALDNDEFILFYQPKVNLENDEIVGYEALIRWASPNYGFISPNEFISIAEENGQIFKLGAWVFEQACEFSKRINNYLKKNINVSVNVSSVELISSNFIPNIEKILKKTDANPKLMGIEITETLLMQSFEASKLILNDLMKLGIQISLDDFGTGYSSLNYLRKLPIDILKIDKSFVNDIENDEGAEILIKSIIEIAHNLNLKIVAEGVETLGQKNILKKYRCDQIQGYLIDTPISEEEIFKKLIASS